ncbi:hypothetical protein O0L34_g12265 [Tuta absoluta]|nr:hypothetical protein O0L34_g12265 [Tuta absoluta]
MMIRSEDMEYNIGSHLVKSNLWNLSKYTTDLFDKNKILKARRNLNSGPYGQRIQINPTTQVVIEGSSLDIMCQVDYPIEDCRFIIGGVSYRLRPTEQEGDVIYRGELQRGQCGAHLSNIRKEWNGNITCSLPPKTGPIEIQSSMNLIVAEPPSTVFINGLPDHGQYRVDDQINVMCLVPDARPVARVIWILRGPEEGHDIQILEGIHQPVVDSVPGTDKYTLKVNLTRRLTAEDGGKKLICRAEHEALQQPLEAAKQFIVNYIPHRSDSADSQITIFGLKIGSEGRLNVTVRASPPPQAEWKVNGQQLNAPTISSDGTIVAMEPMALGNGYYNLTLILKSVEKADVDRTYYLRVRNEEGDADFTVRISTMDEPAGVELDTGAVVGIVIAALVLLIAISLLVFAKATDRWCFAGRGGRGTELPDGGDSEAPLPPHDDVKGAENPSHDEHHYIGNGDTKLPEKKPDTAV